jgi:hypothetical protein
MIPEDVCFRQAQTEGILIYMEIFGVYMRQRVGGGYG